MDTCEVIPPLILALISQCRLLLAILMLELIAGIIIENVEGLTKMENMKIKEDHMQVGA